METLRAHGAFMTPPPYISTKEASVQSDKMQVRRRTPRPPLWITRLIIPLQEIETIVNRRRFQRECTCCRDNVRQNTRYTRRSAAGFSGDSLCSTSAWSAAFPSPEPVAPWSGIYQATVFHPSPWQPLPPGLPPLPYLGDLLGEDYARSGNNGLLDMLLVLRWVHEKIPTWPIPIAQGSPPTLAPTVTRSMRTINALVSAGRLMRSGSARWLTACMG